MLHFVLKIVVENSVLDLATINMKIRSLSKEFQVVGEKAMVDHASYKQGLKSINSDFKFHYCSLCEKPYVEDGSWVGDLCDCHLDESNHAQEIKRRMNLRAVGDPRLDPSFVSLSTKSKLLRTAAFTFEFPRQAIVPIARSSWLYRMTAMPLLRLNLFRFREWNETGFNLLSICILVDQLRKEFCSVGPHRTLLDIALEVLANPSMENEQLLDDDIACIRRFLSDGQQGGRLFASICDSFFKILSLHSSGEDSIIFSESLKNLGNSIGTFLMDPEHKADIFLEQQHRQDMIRRLPETFVWMPIYGGNQEDYVPPVNRFASHGASQI